MKKFNFNVKDRKTLMLGLFLIIVCVFTLTVAYSALSVVLTIQGNAEVVASTWDVYLDNAKVTSGSVSGAGPTITNRTTASFSITLTEPGDFYEFSVDVVNGGTIDAMIESISKTPTLTETQSKYLKYIIEYQNGEAITTKQLVNAGSSVRLKLRIEYRSDISASDIPTSSETLNLKFTVNYTQSDESGSSVSGNGKLINIISGTGTNTGDEVCIGTECFYVISSNEDLVTMLAKYNLHIGYEVLSIDKDTWEIEKRPLISPTGIQDSSSLGEFWHFYYDEDGNIYDWDPMLPFVGTTAFITNDAYWNDDDSDTYTGSIVEGYVNDYKSYLITQGVTPIETRLITLDELINLGCYEEGDEGHDFLLDGSCVNAPSWVYATSYWVNKDIGNIYNVTRNGELNISAHSYSEALGVRPVIVVDKSLL